ISAFPPLPGRGTFQSGGFRLLGDPANPSVPGKHPDSALLAGRAGVLRHLVGQRTKRPDPAADPGSAPVGPHAPAVPSQGDSSSASFDGLRLWGKLFVRPYSPVSESHGASH